jgi:hypothetical protein
MSIVISQPRFLPAANIFHRMQLCDTFVFLDTVQYTKRDYENRTKVLTPQGELWLTVPVITLSQGQLLVDTKIDNSQNWRTKHLRTLEQSYKKRPFFNEIYPFLQEFYSQEWDLLVDMNIWAINTVTKHLGIGCRTIRSSEILGRDSGYAGESLLIEICKQVGDTSYISGANGRDYINLSSWKSAGISVRYHDYNPQPYSQGGTDFVPWLSIIDMICAVGLSATKDLIAINNFKSWQDLPTE